LAKFEHMIYPLNTSEFIANLNLMGHTEVGYLYCITLHKYIKNPKSKEHLEALIEKNTKGLFATDKYRVVDYVNWDSALPIFRKGYLTKQLAFKTYHYSSKGNIIFAGDYLEAPYIEGAVTSGLKAAASIVN
jgi:protoporphyrinogen oxidase